HAVPSSCFLFTDPGAPALYTLSLHDALPISWASRGAHRACAPVPRQAHASGVQRPHLSFTRARGAHCRRHASAHVPPPVLSHMRSEEHTSELQSRGHLVCRLLLEKKKTDMHG